MICWLRWLTFSFHEEADLMEGWRCRVAFVYYEMWLSFISENRRKRVPLRTYYTQLTNVHRLACYNWQNNENILRVSTFHQLAARLSSTVAVYSRSWHEAFHLSVVLCDPWFVSFRIYRFIFDWISDLNSLRHKPLFVFIVGQSLTFWYRYLYRINWFHKYTVNPLLPRSSWGSVIACAHKLNKNGVRRLLSQQ